MDFAPRPITDAEWLSIHGQEDFHKFKGCKNAADVKGQIYVTGSATHTYNCIAWSIGKKDRWVEAGPYLLEYYKKLGYTEVDVDEAKKRPEAGMVCIYGTESAWDSTNIKHVHAIVYNADYRGWESKMGDGIKILHQHYDDLSSPQDSTNFGCVRKCLKPPPKPLPLSPFRTIDTANFSGFVKAYSIIYADVLNDNANGFIKNYSGWRQTMMKKGIEATGDFTFTTGTGAEFNTAEYQKLVQMNNCILPFVIEKLKVPDETLHALKLCKKLWPSKIKQFTDYSDYILLYDTTNQADALFDEYNGWLDAYTTRSKHWSSIFYAKRIFGPDTLPEKTYKTSELALWLKDKEFELVFPFIICDLVEDHYKKSDVQVGWWRSLLPQDLQTIPDASTEAGRKRFIEWRTAVEATLKVKVGE